MLEIKSCVEKKPSKYEKQLKKPLKLGFLSINGKDECCSQMMKGVFEAAKVHNANIIRFAYNTNENDMRKIPFEMTKILEFYSKLKLDGLIFLGWLPETEEQALRSFSRQAGAFPILSLGKVYKNLPSVYMDGGKYLKELLFHLSKVHGYKNIAFISPLTYDDRIKVYMNTMMELSIFEPDLYIASDVLCVSDFDKRAGEAINILIDVRKKKFEAVISMYNDEAVALVRELQKRGMSVPKDVAVTSYDDFESGRFNSPSLTTIHYPYWEIGYTGCEKLIELITTGYTDFSTEIPARVIYRDSCGCTKFFLNNSHYNISNIKGLMKVSDKMRIEAFASEIKKYYPHLHIDIKFLLNLLLASYKDGSANNLFITLKQKFDNIMERFLYPSNFEDLLDIIHLMREFILLLYSEDVNAFKWFENIFYRIHTLVSEKLILLIGQREVLTNKLNQELFAIGKSLITTFDMSKLFDILSTNLSKLEIPGCYIFLFNDEDYSYENCTSYFEYSNNKRKKIKDAHKVCLLKYIDKLLMKEKFILAQLLCIGENPSGVVLFELGPMNERIYNLLAVYLSAAFNGSMLLNNLKIAKRDSEINALQTQINPHFLYNILEILYWETVATEQKNISEMLLNLSKLFRLVLNKGKSFTLISREKELIQCYLNLQKMRFDSKLNFKIEIDGDVLNYMIPKLTLQPFIENAIVHGLEEKTNGGNIEITGKLIGEKIKFKIIDNGVGMSRKTIGKIVFSEDKSYVNKAELLEGYAIRNVIERLKFYFKDECSVKFYSKIGKGTTVEIIIPAEESSLVRGGNSFNG